MKNILKSISIITATLLLTSCGKKTEKTTVQRKNITEMVFASGTLKADDEYNLMAQTEGYISKINFNEGDEVIVNQVLAIIDNPQSTINTSNGTQLLAIAKNNATANAPLLQQAKANLSAATIKCQQDELQAQRYKKLLESNSIAKVEYENSLVVVSNSQANVDALKGQYQNLLVQANQQIIIQKQQLENSQALQNFNEVKVMVNGKVYKQKKQVGDYVRKGDVIAVIANNQKIYANLNIDESNMEKIKLNQQLIIKLNVSASKTYKAVVSEILPTFDEQTQSFIVKAIFTEPIAFTISGTQLEANIFVNQKIDAVVIPRSYLGYGNKILNADKKQIEVKTGIVSSDYVEILEGLKENETILKELN